MDMEGITTQIIQPTVETLKITSSKGKESKLGQMARNTMVSGRTGRSMEKGSSLMLKEKANVGFDHLQRHPIKK